MSNKQIEYHSSTKDLNSDEFDSLNASLESALRKSLPKCNNDECDNWVLNEKTVSFSLIPLKNLNGGGKIYFETYSDNWCCKSRRRQIESIWAQLAGDFL